MPNFLKTYYDLKSPSYTHQEVEELMSRWNSDLKSVQGDIVKAIDTHNKELLEEALLNIGSISYMYHGKNVKLLDLRGIDLSNLNFGDMDFSYCCFDFANFDNCFFDSTHFQYSSFKKASLKHSTWIHVQASPVSLRQSDLSNSVIKTSFFMCSDFYKAHIENIMLIDSGIEGAQMSMFNSSQKKRVL